MCYHMLKKYSNTVSSYYWNYYISAVSSYDNESINEDEQAAIEAAMCLLQLN